MPRKMKYNVLPNYLAYARGVISASEGDSKSLYYDTVHVATIGVGVNVQAHGSDLLDVLGVAGNDPRRAGLAADLSGNNIAQFNADIVAWGNAHGKTINPGNLITDAQDDHLFQVVAAQQEKSLVASVGDLPLSKERAALLSLAYQGNPIRNAGLRKAIADGDRAAAWYAIRYTMPTVSHKGMVTTVAGRRYFESERFGLYDDPKKVGVEEAVDVYAQMSKPTLWSKAVAYDVQYKRYRGTMGENHVAEHVGTLQEELTPAFNVLKAKFAPSYAVAYNSIYASAETHTGAVTVVPNKDAKPQSPYLIIGQGTQETLRALGDRTSILVAENTGATFYGGPKETVEINDAAGGAQFHAGAGATMMYGGAGVDDFYVDGGGGHPVVIYGAGGSDNIHIANKCTIVSVDLSKKLGRAPTIADVEAFFAAHAGESGNTVYVIDGQADKCIVSSVAGQFGGGDTVLTGADAVTLAAEDYHFLEVSGHPVDMYVKIDSNTDYWGFKRGNAVYSTVTTNKGTTLGTDFNPSGGELSVTVGDNQVEFANFENGFAGIWIGANHALVTSHSISNIYGGVTTNSTNSEMIASADFYSYRAEADPTEAASAALAMRAETITGSDPVVLSGTGGDTFDYSRGDGWVQIDETDSSATPGNVLRMGAGINPDDVEVIAEDDRSLALALGGSDYLELLGQTDSSPGATRGIQEIHFSDGTVWTRSDLVDRDLIASSTKSLLLGDGRANTIDTQGLVGSVVGGGGGDTFAFGLGYGLLEIDELERGSAVNSITFGAGIDSADVTVDGDEDGNIMLSVGTDGDAIILAHGLESQTGALTGVQELHFADGTTWTYADLLARLLTPGTDKSGVYGDNTANILDPGGIAGLASGGGGGDTFVYDSGYGDLTISEFDTAVSPSNVLTFGTGIDPDDVSIGATVDGDIQLTLADGSVITITGALLDHSNGVQTIGFADGTTWSYSDLLSRLLTPNSAIDGIFGDATANTLDGGGTVGYARGGGGGDAFIYHRGYGNLLIAESDDDAAPVNSLHLAGAIDPATVAVIGTADGDLTLSLGGNDVITIAGALLDTHNGVQSVQFDDGTVWSYQDLLAKSLAPAAGKDMLVGDTAANQIDTAGLVHSVVGGGGGDTIAYNVGYGALAISETADQSDSGTPNKLVFANGILPDDVSVTGDPQGDLVLDLGNGDVITIAGQLLLDSNTESSIQTVAFSDGTEWGAVDLAQLAGIAGAGHSTLYGDAGANVLAGAGSASILIGNGGDDTFLYGAGDGDVTIEETSSEGGSSTLQFGEGIAPGAITVGVSGNDLVLTIASGGTVTLIGMADPDGDAGVSLVSFADGSVWSSDDLKSFATGQVHFGSGSDIDIDEAALPAGASPLILADAALTPAMISTVAVDGGSTLVLQSTDGATITLRNVNPASSFDILRFADGTTWSADDVRALTRIGTAANSDLYGTAVAETFTANAFARTVTGGGGGDTIEFSPGAGTLVIDERDSSTSPHNRLVFSAGIDASDVTVGGDEDGNIVLSLASGDQIYIIGGLNIQSIGSSGQTDGIQSYEFADGTVWTASDIVARATTASAGNTRLYGDGNANTIDPAGVADYVAGGGGGDRIVYERGYGSLTIDESDVSASPANAIVFGAGINPEDVILNGSSIDLGNGDVISILRQGDRSEPGVNNGIQRLEFADGTVRYLPYVTYGSSVGSTVDTAGHSDAIVERGGGDTILFGHGYGNVSLTELDTSATPGNVVKLAAGITSANVSVDVDDNGGLVLDLGSGDRLTIANPFGEGGDGVSGIQAVDFDDGNSWTRTQLLAMASTAAAGRTAISGGVGADLLDGAGLVHHVFGGGGGDTIHYDHGDGSLIIDESDTGATPTNKLEFGSGILVSDVTVSGAPDGLILTVAGSGTVKIANGLVSIPDLTYGVQTVQFADGTTWSYADLLEKSLTPTTSARALYGDRNANVVDTLGIAHEVNGQSGGDTIIYNTGYGDLHIDANYYGGTNVLQMGAGILPANVEVFLNNGAVALKMGDGSIVQLGDYYGFYNYGAPIQEVHFANGTIWTEQDLIGQLAVAKADKTEITGTFYADTLDPLGLVSLVEGGGGADTIIYHQGYGSVTITEPYGDPSGMQVSLGTGILASATTVSNDEQGNVHLAFGNGDEVVFSSGTIGTLNFADGSRWSPQDILAKLAIGSAANTVLTGDDNAQQFDPAGFAHQVVGGGGGDTILYRRGYGALDVDEANNTNEPNTLVFGADIAPGDVIVGLVRDSSGYDDHDSATLDLGNGDVINLIGFFGGTANIVAGIDRVLFADGTVWTHADIVARANQPSANQTVLVGDGGANTFDSLGIARTVIGKGGGDIIAYQQGYGALEVDETTPVDPGDSTADLIQMRTGVTPSMVTVVGDPDQLDLHLDLGNGDVVTIDKGGNANSPVGVSFADGTIWSGSELYHLALTGSAGKPEIYGFQGDDRIDPAGVSHLAAGGDGNDTYIFNAGYGLLTISDASSSFDTGDILEFGAGISAHNVIVGRDGTDLLLLSGGSDQVRVGNYFGSAEFGEVPGIREVHFSDGTIWTADDIDARLSAVVEGTAGDDDLAGSSANDTLIGGPGNDTLNGGDGSDTYVFAPGDGQDVINDVRGSGISNVVQFGSGIAPGDIYVYTANAGSDIVLGRIDGTDTITISAMNSDTTKGVDEVHFADGTVWSDADIMARRTSFTAGNDTITGTSGNETLYGAAGDDTLRGLAGNDVLDGGTGNDLLYGGDGDDVYRFAPGDGQDLVADFPSGSGTGGVDTIQLGAGILPADVSVTQAQNGADLVLSFAGSSDQITLSNAIGSSLWRIEQVTFANGTNWSYSDLMAKATTPTSGNDTIYGDESSQTLSGGAGNDNLYGARGDDILIGGTGNDYLNGGPGSDTYVFAQGDGNDTIDDTRPSGSVNSIQLGAGITQQNTFITTSANGLDIVVGFVDSSDTISIRYMNISTSNGVDQIKFADGSSWSSADIMARRTAFTAGDDTITGSSGNETLYGSDGNDTLLGLAGNDSLAGGAGNDTLTGGAGNDVLNGGSGSDIAVFAGLQNDYQLTTSGGALSITDLQPTVSGDDGTDQLIGVETAQFSDQSVSLAAPVILDLDGNGVSLVDRTQSTTSFDWNGDGVADHTGWTGQGDAFLALDRNHDGRIDSVAELSFANDKPGAKSDLDGLSAFDSNGDGKLSADDSAFGDFRVWQDTNANGVSDAGEVKSLTDAGIAAIDLTGSAVNQSWAWDANVTINTGTFERTDGSVGQLADAALNYEPSVALPPAVGVAANLGQSGHWRLPHDWAKPFGPPRLRMPIEPLGDLASTNGDLDHFRAASSFSEQLAAFVPESAPDWTGRNQGEKTDDIWFANHRRSDGSLLTQSGASIF